MTHSCLDQYTKCPLVLIKRLWALLTAKLWVFDCGWSKDFSSLILHRQTHLRFVLFWVVILWIFFRGILLNSVINMFLWVLVHVHFWKMPEILNQFWSELEARIYNFWKSDRQTDSLWDPQSQCCTLIYLLNLSCKQVLYILVTKCTTCRLCRINSLGWGKKLLRFPRFYGLCKIITDIDSKNIALINLIMQSIQTKSFSFRQVSNGVIIQHNPIRVHMY